MKTHPDDMPPSSDSETAPPEPFWRKFLGGQGENIRILAVALAIAVFMRLFIAEPRFIPSNSMEPTLHIGDRLLVEKVSYRLHPPESGDVVVFQPPPQLRDYGYTGKQAFIKRVIGTPGSTIAVTEHHLYVDGKQLEEPYVLDLPEYSLPSFTVPPDSVFVLGDNRNDSNDSHVWGFLPAQNIIGVARLRFWPLSRFGPVA